MVKKRGKKKTSPKRFKKEPKKIVTPKKVRKTTKSLIYSLVIFILSGVLYTITYDYFWESIFGLIAILSGALVILFVIIEIIFFFIRKKEGSR